MQDPATNLSCAYLPGAPPNCTCFAEHAADDPGGASHATSLDCCYDITRPDELQRVLGGEGCLWGEHIDATNLQAFAARRPRHRRAAVVGARGERSGRRVPAHRRAGRADARARRALGHAPAAGPSDAAPAPPWARPVRAHRARVAPPRPPARLRAPRREKQARRARAGRLYAPMSGGFGDARPTLRLAVAAPIVVTSPCARARRAPPQPARRRAAAAARPPNAPPPPKPPAT